MVDLTTIERHFRYSADERQARSPLTAQLCRSIADDPPVMSLLTAAPRLQQLPVLLLAAVHSIVLAEPELELGGWYSTVTADPRTDDAYPAFARLCAERGDEIRAIVATHSTQTNEIGRCALLLPGLAEIAFEVGPISLLDVGTSAGLNLQLDRYGYRYTPGGEVLPDDGWEPTVMLECGTRGALPRPRSMPAVVDRLGLDRNPIDITDADQVRWLMACVWPDQRDRLERLRAALAVAESRPVRVVRGDAVESLAECVDSLDPAAHPVIINSWVLNYLAPDSRIGYLAILDEIGRERDLTWLFAEALSLAPEIAVAIDVPGSQVTNLVRVRWRDGVRTVEHLAECHPHGYWMHWR